MFTLLREKRTKVEKKRAVVCYEVRGQERILSTNKRLTLKLLVFCVDDLLPKDIQKGCGLGLVYIIGEDIEKECCHEKC